jgi:hypothetical protein
MGQKGKGGPNVVWWLDSILLGCLRYSDTDAGGVLIVRKDTTQTHIQHKQYPLQLRLYITLTSVRLGVE